MSETLVTMNTALGSIDRFVGCLQDPDASFNRLLVQLRTSAAKLDRTLDEAQLGGTTASIRNAAGAVNSAATGFGDMREDLQASLATLRETLDSFRAIADSLERDPSLLLRGPRPDVPRPRGTK